jgi:hypothetical protein
MSIFVPVTLGEVLALKGRTFEKNGRTMYIEKFYYNVDYWSHGSVVVHDSDRAPFTTEITIQSLQKWLEGASEKRES